MKSILAALVLATPLALTSCDPYLDDVLGEWSRPTPGNNTPSGGGSDSGTVLPEGTLAGVFSVDASKKVHFSKGNLQATYDGSAWSWAFAANQWDYIGDAEGNNKVWGSTPFVSGYSGTSTTVDLFGWVGSSSTWTGVNKYGITTSTATNATDGYGNSTTDDLSDWGANIGTGWRTLTGGATGEWQYLLNTRTTTSGIRYAKATVNSKSGIILLPDDWDTSYYSLNSTNTDDAAYTTNNISSDDWTNKLEAHGAVFLPAAGYRSGNSMFLVGTEGYYWSSTPDESYATKAYHWCFGSSKLFISQIDYRNKAFSVRLVRNVE